MSRRSGGQGRVTPESLERTRAERARPDHVPLVEEIDWKDVDARLADGATLKQIATALEMEYVPFWTAHRARKRPQVLTTAPDHHKPDPEAGINRLQLWDEIETEWRRGILPVEGISARFGPTVGQINARMTARGVDRRTAERERADRVRKAALVRAGGDAVALEVLTAIEIVREHRVDIRRANEVTRKMFTMVEQHIDAYFTAANDPDPDVRAAAFSPSSVASLAKATASLVQSLGNTIALEREAVGISAGTAPVDPLGDVKRMGDNVLLDKIMELAKTSGLDFKLAMQLSTTPADDTQIKGVVPAMDKLLALEHTLDAAPLTPTTPTTLTTNLDDIV